VGREAGVSEAPRKLGIIAGGGELPLKLADVCRESGRPYAVCALRGWADERAMDDHPHRWFGIGELSALTTYFNKEQVEEVVFAGNVQRPDFKSLKIDWAGAKLLPRALLAARQGDDALLRMLVEIFEDAGFDVVGAHEVLSVLLIEQGSLGVFQPDEESLDDIAKARAVVDALGALDVGQGAVVARGLVLAVEAAEGTDAMLDRVAGLRAEIRGSATGKVGVLLKLPKRGQERRIDLPTIGKKTVQGAARAGLKGIAVAAGAALVIDREEVARLADQLGLFVVGVEDGESE
jgi:DUF1009 family protein